MLIRFDHDVLKIGGALLIAVVAGVVIGRPAEIPDVEIAFDPGVDSTIGQLGRVTVHVSGAVVSAGLVEVPESARVADAIAAAGGVTALADLGSINLAEMVSDGRQVVVPAVGSNSTGSQTSDAGGSMVRINSADASVLEGLPGVGPVLAEKIVAHRDEFGPFTAVEDLLDVPGIGERKLASFRDLVAVP